MDTNTFNFKSLTDKVSEGLKKAQQEVEELALQFALGRADATDKFEEIKKEFSHKVNEWKLAFPDLKSINQEKINLLKSKIENLLLQLSLGKADAIDNYVEQHKKIMQSIQEFEAELKTDPELVALIGVFKIEIEKLKLKLEILKLKFELKKFETKAGFNSEMEKARLIINKLFEKIEGKWDETKSNYSDFSDEIELSWKHLKNAVKSL